MTRSYEEMVAEFQTAFETSNDPELWMKLVDEELTEAEEALAAYLKEACDAVYVLAGLTNVVRTPEQADALVERLDKFERRLERMDSLASNGFAAVFDSAFARVHASNMSKLDDNGKPVRRDDGKVLKGPNYRPPVLIDLITGEEA